MKGSEFFKTLSNNVVTRESQILNAVLNDGSYWEWVNFDIEFEGHTISGACSVMPLAIGDEDDHIFVNVSAQLAEDITDHFDLAPMTARLSDRIYQAATMVLPPSTQPAAHVDRVSRGYSPQMHDVGANIRSDADIKRSRAKALKAGKCPALVDGPFKWWVATVKDRKNRVANYGMYGGAEQGTLLGVRVVNRVLFGHSKHHLDYSQFYRGIIDAFVVTFPDGHSETMTFGEIATHPELWPVVSHEGPMSDSSLLPKSEDLPFTSKPTPARIERTLRRGMTGEDVAAWQRTIGLDADGIFGPNTEAATKGFQRANGLAADGVVGPMTRAAARDNRKLDDSDWDDDVDIDKLPFVEAKNYNRTRRTDIRQIVIHDMEAPKLSTTAESVAAYFAGTYTAAPMASAHVNIDNDSAVMSVPWECIAYHAKGANRYGVGFEHAGFARQKRAEWLDDYSTNMLWQSAQIAAQLCTRYDIPIRVLTEDEVKRDEAGFTTHAMVTKAKGIRGGHYDPGPNFPFEYYMKLVRRAMQLFA